MFRSYILPFCVVLYFDEFVYDFLSIYYEKIVRTLLWISVVWVLTLIFTHVVFFTRSEREWKTRVPRLFVDLIRLLVILVGSTLIFGSIWKKDLGGLITTLGVSSLVIGLALQDTLGNLFSGIAVLFEKPFERGDWIKVDSLVGEVVESNWRAIRLRTRDNELVVIPNSILGKEKIYNYSKPSKIYFSSQEVSFSYQDPPNLVKEVILSVLRNTSGVINSELSAEIRTIGFEDSSIKYLIRYEIDEFQDLSQIQERVNTKIWYAIKRAGISIPFPIRTVYKTEVPYVSQSSELEKIDQVVKKSKLFNSVGSENYRFIIENSRFEHFGTGEVIIEQGAVSKDIYIIVIGEVKVVRVEEGIAHEISKLSDGMIFGEMALIEGSARHASIIASRDVLLVKVNSHCYEAILKKMPQLADEIKLIASARREELLQSRNEIIMESEDLNKSSFFLEIRKFLKR